VRPATPAALREALESLVPSFRADREDDSAGYEGQPETFHRVMREFTYWVGTCFLEHLHQVKALKILRPFLSAHARARCHA